ncbi:MAG: hypothetical protein Q9166_007857 [cf. Caloplaca sp. 2 TL-2023]
MNVILRLVAKTAVVAAACYIIKLLVSRIKYERAIRNNHCAKPCKYGHKDPLLGLDLFMEIVKAFGNGSFLETNRHHFNLYGKTFEANSWGVRVIKTTQPEVMEAVYATFFKNFGMEPLRLDVGGPFFGKEFIFGESANSLNQTSSLDAQRFLQAFDDAVAGVAKRVMMGRIRHLVRDKKWEVACRTVHDYCDKHVAAALQEQKESAPKQSATEVDRWVLLREMAKETHDPLDLRYQILNVFSPGRDSTGILLSNVFFFVARQPSSWTKVRNEVLSLEGKPLDYNTLNSLKFVHYCLKESLRLAPFATFNQRICLQDTVLPTGGGNDGTEPLFVKRGDVIETNFYAMHRDRDIWGDDADEFWPERWEMSHPPWAFMGFNGGPRTCPAQQMVYTEAAYVIARLARQFVGLENRDPCEAWQEEMRLNFQSKNGVKVGMVAQQ